MQEWQRCNWVGELHAPEKVKCNVHQASEPRRTRCGKKMEIDKREHLH